MDLYFIIFYISIIPFLHIRDTPLSCNTLLSAVLEMASVTAQLQRHEADEITRARLPEIGGALHMIEPPAQMRAALLGRVREGRHQWRNG